MNRGKEFAAFCRSLLPADWGQLLLLAGSYLLYISWELRWWPHVLQNDHVGRWFGSEKIWLTTNFTHWVALHRTLAVPLFCAGVAGFYLFFWGGPRCTRRLILWVILPSAVAIATGLCAAVLLFQVDPYSIESDVFHVHPPSLLAELAKQIGPGLHAAVAGLVLVCFSVWRVARGRMILPAALPVGAEPEGDVNDLRRFTWAVLALVVPMSVLLVAATGPLLERVMFAVGKGRVPDYWLFEIEEGSVTVLGALPLALVGAYLMGAGRGKELARLLSLRRWGILTLGVAFPLLIHWTLKILSLLAARLYWATYESRLVMPGPEIREYLWPGRWQWDLLLFPAAALLVELAWRGYALRRFVDRLGLHRGIVLLGIFWGLLNSQGEWLPVGGDLGILTWLASAPLWGVALSYPLAWLTMRSGSVLPAAALVAVSWMLRQTGGNEPEPLSGWLASPYVATALWALLGLVLFRYFGVEERTKEI